MTRVRHVGPERLFWSAGRGPGDSCRGVEVWVDNGGRVWRRIFLRAKYGRETLVAEEAYSKEEYAEIIQAEGEIMALRGEKGARELVGEALARLRLAYAMMTEGGGKGVG